MIPISPIISFVCVIISVYIVAFILANLIKINPLAITIIYKFNAFVMVGLVRVNCSKICLLFIIANIKCQLVRRSAKNKKRPTRQLMSRAFLADRLTS